MDSIVWFVALGALIAVVVGALRRGHIGVADARRLLSEGAVLVDVRSEREFVGSRVDGAINIPLEEIARRLPHAVPEKDTPVLLHCHSGGRSGIAVTIARKSGYRNAFNLGSFRRARKVVGKGQGGMA